MTVNLLVICRFYWDSWLGLCDENIRPVSPNNKDVAAPYALDAEIRSTK